MESPIGGGPTLVDWTDFTSWVKSRLVVSQKDLRRRQVSLFEADPVTLDGGRGARRGAKSAGRDEQSAGVRASAPLVNRCISQHTRRNALLGIRFEVFPKSVRVVRPVALPPGATRGGLRSDVDGFSEASKRRLRRVASEAGDSLVSQFCLTYHLSDPDGETVKRHLNTWLTWLRRRVPGIKYLWVLEFQRRGVPHFHVFLSVDIHSDNKLHADMAKKWHAITCEEDKAHLNVHLNAKNWIRWDMGTGSYVCKYIDKQNQKNVPDYFGWVGRFWGSSRSLMPKPDVYDTHEMRAICGQNVDKARIGVAREAHGRDSVAVLLRALGEFQKAQWRRYGRKGKHLSQAKSSRWVQGGASVLWRVAEMKLGGQCG